MRNVLAFIAFLSLPVAVAHAAVADFVDEIRPLLVKHCYACHSGDQPKSGLRLDLKAAAFKGGPVLVHFW